MYKNAYFGKKDELNQKQVLHAAQIWSDGWVTCNKAGEGIQSDYL